MIFFPFYWYTFSIEPSRIVYFLCKSLVLLVHVGWPSKERFIQVLKHLFVGLILSNFQDQYTL